YVGTLHFILDIETEKIEIIRRLGREAAVIDRTYSAVWQHQDRWIALGDTSLCLDLFGDQPKHVRISMTGIGGGTIRPKAAFSHPSAIRLGVDLYLNVFGTLYECDPSGTIGKVWPGSAHVRPAESLLGACSFDVPVHGVL